VAELDPNNPIGSRITSTVTQNKLSRALFGWVGDKVTYIYATDDQTSPKVFQFASDEAWNRVVLGQKDVYIHQFSQVDSATSLQGPLGIDYTFSGSPDVQVFIADRANERVVKAHFDTAHKSLSSATYTHSDPDLNGVTDVVVSGFGPPWYFYAVSVTGRVSYWTIDDYNYPSGNKLWAYGSIGNGTGQFEAPKGICVGHAPGANGGSTFTADFYVADGANHRLVWLQNDSPSGPTWMGAVTLPNGGVPLDCTVDHFGNVTVADSLNSQLIKYTWNLIYLDTYGTYGVGANNDNTFAHPHAVDVPFGVKGSRYSPVWFGDGRVITAEDWGTQSGAREHYFGINGSITAQPNSSAQFSYLVTDHGSQTVTVVNPAGATVRTLVNDALYPSGTRTVSWDGNTNQGTLASPSGNYKFSVVATSAYGCSGQAWCSKTLVTGTFFHQGPPIASISGPSSVNPYTSHTWTAGVSDGVSPYTYQWTVDGASAGTGSSVTAANWDPGTTHPIVLRVTDSLGHSGSYELDVNVTACSPCAPGCRC